MKPTLREEYEEFANSKPTEPGPALSSKVRERILRELHPAPAQVMTKLLAVHVVASVISLSFCPQFGVQFFSESMGIMRYFMTLGPFACTALCGAFFMFVSIASGLILLSPEEVRTLRRHRVLGLTALVSITLAFFWMLNAELVLGLTLAWLIGAYGVGFAALEFARVISEKQTQRSHRH